MGTILWAIGGALVATALIVITIYAEGGEVEAADAALAGIVGVLGGVVALVGLVVFRRH